MDEFPAVSVNTESEILCGSGKRTQMCGKYTARWEAPVNHDCMCTVPDAPFEIESTPLFGEATVACEVGSRSVLCGQEGQFVNLDDSECFCAAADGFEQTIANTAVSAACAENGDRLRVFKASGFWSEIDYSSCICNSFIPITDCLLIL